MRRLLALTLLLASPAFAVPPGWLKRPGVGWTGPTTNPSANAILYAPFNVAGCYSTGDTTLARNASGTGVAATFSRASTAYYLSSPTGTANAAYWNSCASGQLRVGSLWYGANLEPPGNNQFLTPTDSPTSSGNWALIAAGPTVTANTTDVTFIDGTQTASKFVESAGVVSGIQQTITVTTNPYFMSGFFYSGNVLSTNARVCWGMSLDGATVHAKFDIVSGKVTYKDSAATTQAGIYAVGQGWVWAWAKATLTAGAVTPQFFATAACTDNTKAAPGAAFASYISRVMFSRRSDTFTPDQPYSYVAAGGSRAAESLSFPLSMPDGNICISAKVVPMNSTWDTRLSWNIFSAYGATTTYQAANSMDAYISQNGKAWCEVWDNAGAQKLVSFTPFNPQFNVMHVVKCCTDTSGNVTLGYDGSSTLSVTSGAGTGILTTPPTQVFLGTQAGSGNFNQVSSIAISDFAVCSNPDPNACGDWALPIRSDNAVVGDSISVSPGWVTGSNVTAVWPAIAASNGNTHIATIGRASWYTYHALPGWNSAKGHRYRKVAVLVGINDINSPANGSDGLAASAFDNLRQLYQQIIADGATPIPMTVLPTALLSAPHEAERKKLNLAILNWCATYGYTCADSASFMADPSDATHLNPAYLVGSIDTIHPGQAGETALGAFMAPFFQ